MAPACITRNEAKGEAKLSDEARGAYLANYEKISLFIHDFDTFANWLKSARDDIQAFTHDFLDKGEGHLIYVFTTLEASTLSGDHGQLVRKLAAKKEGIYLGGNIDNQRLLNFDGVPGIERNQSLSPGTGHSTISGKTSKIVTIEP